MRQVLSVISTVVLILVVLLAFLSIGVMLFGLHPYVVLSGSMEPALRTGSVAYVRSIEPEDVEVGDIITFSIDSDTVATHRVVEIVGSGSSLSFRTKGDANNVEDSALVRSSQLVGKAVFSIPELGRLLEYIHTPKGRNVAIVVGVALVLLVALPDALFPKNRRRAGTRAGIIPYYSALPRGNGAFRGGSGRRGRTIIIYPPRISQGTA